MSTRKLVEKLEIFISSPGDVAAERLASIEVIRRLQDSPQIDQRFALRALAFEERVPPIVGVAPQLAVDEYMTQASAADIFVCILGQRIGTRVVDSNTGESYASGTAYEFETAYRAASQTKKPVILVYRIQRPAPSADPSQRAALEAFLGGFNGPEPRYVGFRPLELTGTDAFAKRLLDDLSNVLGHWSSNTEAPAPKRRDHIQHVRLPENFVRRPEVLDQLRRSLLTDAGVLDEGGRPQPRTVLLQAMGGSGKSVMARAMCDDDHVQAAFDSIIWLELGQHVDIDAKLFELALALEPKTYETIAARPSRDVLRAQLAAHLRNCSCLLVLDNVWSSEVLDAFDLGGPRCGRLVTARDAAVGRLANAKVIDLSPPDLAQAVEMLERWSKGKSRQLPAADRDSLCQRLGLLPLALKLVGARLQTAEPSSWVGQTSLLARLEDQNPSHDPRSSVRACLNESIEALSERLRVSYRSLGIFQEAIPVKVIQRYWAALFGMTSVATLDALAALQDAALLDRSAESAVTLHDLLRELLAEQPQSALGELHGALLAAYERELDGASLSSLEDDGYIVAHLFHHLLGANALQKIRTLLRDERWMRRRFVQAGSSHVGYLNDLQLTRQMASARARDEIEAGQAPGHFADVFRCLLTSATLAGSAEVLPPAAVGRALETSLWSAARAIESVRTVINLEKKVRLLRAVLASTRLGLRDRELAEQLVVDAVLQLDGAPSTNIHDQRRIQDEAERLLPLVRGKTAMDALLALARRPGRVYTLTEAAADMSEAARQPVIDAALSRADVLVNHEAAHALAAIAAVMVDQERENILRRALDAVEREADPKERAHALAAIARRSSGSERIRVLQLSLQASRQVQDVAERGRALAAVATADAAAEVIDEVQRDAAALPSGWRGFVFASICTALTQREGEAAQRSMKAALEGAASEADSSLRRFVLETLGPNLDASLLPDARALACGLAKAPDRISALAALARRAPSPLREELFALAWSALDEIPPGDWAARDEAFGLQALALLVPTRLAGAAVERAFRLWEREPAWGSDAISAVLTTADAVHVGACISRLMKRALSQPPYGYAPRDHARHVAEWLRTSRDILGGPPALPTPVQAEDLATTNGGISGRDATADELHAALAAPPASAKRGIWQALALHLPDDLLDDAVAGASALVADPSRADWAEVWRSCVALAALASRLDAKRKLALQQRVLADLSYVAVGYRSFVLKLLFTALDPAAIPDAMRSIDQFRREPGGRWMATDALRTLIPGVASNLVQPLLDAILAIEDDDDRVVGLSAIASHLEPADAIRAFQHEESRGSRDERKADVIVALASRLPREGIDDALRLTKTLGSRRERARALAALLPRASSPEGVLRRLRLTLIEYTEDLERSVVGALLSAMSEEWFQPPALSAETRIRMAEAIEDLAAWSWP